ncbi:MAG: hypothetical protein ABI726_00655 [bacterium]
MRAAAARTACAAAIAAALCAAAPALAGTKELTGGLEVNDAPVTVEVAQRGGRIRKVTDFEAGDYFIDGVPIDCGPKEPDDLLDPPTRIVYPGSPYAWKVRRDRSFEADQTEAAMIGLTIEGRFNKRRNRTHGTISFDGPVFEKPWYCRTDGALAWSAAAG